MARGTKRSIDGLVVAITGGARGIGLETTRRLAARGAKVGAGDIHLDELEAEHAKIGGETAAFELDVTDRDSFAEFLDEIEDRFGPIDVLINNAGIMGLRRFVDEPDEMSALQIDVNFKGVLFGTQLALRRMLPRRSGHVINISSAAGRVPAAGAATYSGTKFAVYGMTAAIAGEHRDDPIDFTVVMPNVVRTELTDGVHRKTKLARALSPDEVAEAIVGAIERPRFAVMLPSSLAPSLAIAGLLPYSWQRALERWSGADKLLVEIDTERRAAYDERAFESQTRERAGH